MSLFIKVSGYLIFFLVVLTIQVANARGPHIEIGKPQISRVTAKTDFDNKIIIVTANVLNKDRYADDVLYFGGNFSPTLTTHLKSAKRNRLNAFAQVYCITPDCSQLGVAIGIRNTVGNPYAYNEQRFVITRNN